MKIEIIKEKLLSGLIKTERVAHKHPTLPVLSCVLCDVRDGVLTLTATNLDAGVKISVPVKMGSAGSVAVPSALFTTIVTHAPPGSVLTITSDEKQCSVKAATRTSQLRIYPHEEFPSLPTVDGEARFSIGVKYFISGLKSVWYSAAVSPIKPELSSVFFTTQGDNFVFAATDAFRLAEKKIPISGTPEFLSLLIPQKNVLDLMRIFEEEEGDLKISASRTQLCIEKDDIYFTSRVIEGVFPEYGQLIPKKFIAEAIALKQDVVNALKVSSLFSEKFNMVRIQVHPKDKQYSFEVKNSDIGENTEQVSAALSGEDLEVSVNHKYLMECFQSIAADSVSFQYSGANTPLVVRGVGDDSFLYLVMPMNQQ